MSEAAADDYFILPEFYETVPNIFCSQVIMKLTRMAPSFVLCLVTSSLQFLFIETRTTTNDPQEGNIRLVGGRTPSEGNVEIYHAGRYGSICDDEWDIREAAIVCRTLGYPDAVQATHNSDYGKSRGMIWMDNLYCSGSEKSLTDCKFDGWGLHDCTSSESAGVVCNETGVQATESTTRQIASKSAKLQVPLKKAFQLRIRGGRNSFEGRVEINFGEKWGLICGDGWSLLESNVVCQQLGLGYGQAAVQSAFFGGSGQDVLLSGLTCTGRELNISECDHHGYGQVFCPGTEENIAGVICAKELPDLVPDEEEVERSAYLQDRQLLYLQCAMEENCLASAVYEMNRNEDGWHYEQRRLLRFTARIGNVGTADFLPFLPKHAWQWHSCHVHYHSMEIFARFDVTDSRGFKVAEGHKASFCLEDSHCVPTTEKKYACANYGDQGISVGCTDTYAHNIDCQWVDITDLKPGIYRFKVSINPEFKVAELNYDNNAVLCVMYYNAISVRLFNCSLTRP